MTLLLGSSEEKAEEGCSESGSRRWKFWKKSSRPGASESHRSASEVVEEEEVAALYASTSVCSPHNDFKVVRQAFAAIRIQAAFRGCLVFEISLSLCLSRYSSISLSLCCLTYRH